MVSHLVLNKNGTFLDSNAVLRGSSGVFLEMGGFLEMYVSQALEHATLGCLSRSRCCSEFGIGA